MAANRSIAGAIGKRFVNQILLSPTAPAAPVSASRRSVHASTYDKDIEEQVRPTIVPDEVIDAHNSDKYWGPNPSTGVFGPANPAASARSTGQGRGVGTSTVLDQKVWFRPSEDAN